MKHVSSLKLKLLELPNNWYLFLQSKDVHQYCIILICLCTGRNIEDLLHYHSQNQETKAGKMWGQYHCLKTSKKFLSDWKEFLSEITEIVPPAAFIQHVIHEIFKQMMKVQFPPRTAASKTLPLLTDIKVNALCYVAGYMCHTIHDHLKTLNVEGKRC